MLALAAGFSLLTDPDFVPNGSGRWPGLSRMTRAAISPVTKMFHDGMHANGLAIYLRASAVRQFIPDACISAAGWATAPGKRKGRGNSPLNSWWVKEASDALWGRISLPTIGDHGRMILDFCDWLDCPWEDLRIWKKDLAGAFTLLSCDPGAVRHMAIEVDKDVVVFFLCGIFGWTGMPAAFNVVTRTILWELSAQLRVEFSCMLMICSGSAMSGISSPIWRPPRLFAVLSSDRGRLPRTKPSRAGDWSQTDTPLTWIPASSPLPSAMRAGPCMAT